MTAKCELSVHAGPHTRFMCPVSVGVDWSYDEAHNVQLRDASTKKAIPCQVVKTKNGIALTWLVNGLKAGETQRLIATASKSANDKPLVSVIDHDKNGKAEVYVGGKLFTAYHYGNQWVRPFLHPVIGPKGTQVTRNWPIINGVKGETDDHPHHKSIWIAYGECDKVDNWSEDPGHGYQRHRAFLSKVSGSVFGRIVAKNDWCANNGKKQFEEVRSLCFYGLPGGVRLVDVEVSFKMTERAVVFRDTKEGGLLSVRVASSLDVPRGGTITNGYGGVDEDETWGKSAPWCDYSGQVDGAKVGIAVFDHETNPRYPTQWHVRNYGLMTANCFAWSHYRPEAKIRGDMEFGKGSTTTWRYRLYIHNGDAKQGKVAERFLDFIAPPKVTVG